MHSYEILFIISLLFSTLYSKSSAYDISPEKPTKLTSRNFHIILSLDDPWIVIFLEDYDAKKEAELVALATSVVGLVQIGFVDMDDPDSEELVEAKVFQDSILFHFLSSFRFLSSFLLSFSVCTLSFEGA